VNLASLSRPFFDTPGEGSGPMVHCGRKSEM
jgi:hypothetical protein